VSDEQEVEALRTLLSDSSKKRKESQQQLVAVAAAAIAAATAAGVSPTTIFRAAKMPSATDTVNLRALVKQTNEDRKKGHEHMKKTSFAVRIVEDVE
jgi:hypothetical protein